VKIHRELLYLIDPAAKVNRTLGFDPKSGKIVLLCNIIVNPQHSRVDHIASVRNKLKIYKDLRENGFIFVQDGLQRLTADALFGRRRSGRCLR